MSVTETHATKAVDGDAPVTRPGSEPLASIALDLVRATANAAASCAGWIGAGDKVAADQAAVDAMRAALGCVKGRGVVVIGEGEKDEAPMLYASETLGVGDGPAFDLAVDPLEGTNLCATGAPGAVTVLGAAPRGSMMALHGFYMDKIVVGPEARDAIEIDAPIEVNLRRVATAKAKRLGDLRVAVLARPRHEALIRQIRVAGARVVEISDGDVMVAVAAMVPDGGIDLTAGIGGAPEGVVTACLVQALGGELLGRLAPQSDTERETVDAAGQAGVVYSSADLVRSDECVFVASGVTGSAALSGVTATAAGWVVHSVLASRGHGLVRLTSEVRAPRTASEEEAVA